MSEVVRLEGVSHIFPPEQRVFRGVDCSFSSGFSVVFGPAGSGKTTLARLICGLQRPSLGEVTVLNTPLSSLSARDLAQFRRTRIGFISAEMDFFHELTLLQNILLPFTLFAKHSTETRKKAIRLFEQLGIQPLLYSYPRAANQYQLRLAALARALVTQPSLLVVDEATRGLTAHQAGELLRLLTQMAGGVSILLLTSDPALLPGVCEHYQISDGTITEVTQ